MFNRKKISYKYWPLLRLFNMSQKNTSSSSSKNQGLFREVLTLVGTLGGEGHEDEGGVGDVQWGDH